MRRRLFNVLAGVSLVLFMVTAGIWARTYWRQDQFQTVSRRYDFDTTPGRVWLDYSNPPYFAGSGYRARPVANDRFGQQFHGFFTIMPAPGGRSYAVCGFVYLTYLQPGPPWPCRFKTVGVPFWFITLLTGMIPLIWLQNRFTRKLPGQCAVCGYDLRATPDRCPECGTVPKKTDKVST
jgi:hypothetical protein